ncbi:AI-2E family transporter [Kallotenue papyrolyticum]|uniref:AI-2E family transporter n=1 Tax=Kallotenue papyrolyticum TaxID=1325125 RepID=UPI0004926AA0|nr:AI-2E family transporter [Kallotenue papyrolyticum]
MQPTPRRIVFPPWAKIATIAIIIALTILLLRAVGGLLDPFLWAIVAAYLLNPLVTRLSYHTGLRRVWWVIVLYIVAGLTIYLGINTLAPRLARQYSDLLQALPDFATRLSHWIAAHGVIDVGGITLDLRPNEQEISAFFAELSREIPRSVPEIVLGVFERLVLLLVFLVVTFYLLLEADQLTEHVYALIPAPYRGEIRELGRSIDRVLGAYIRSQLLLIVIMAALTYVPLSILGVQYALVLAIATGFLEIIPFVGPWSAAGIAMLVSLLQDGNNFGWPNWLLALVVGLIYLILRQMEDHLIIPNLVGRIVKLHPVVVIFAILAGAALGGALGLLLAVPVAATIKILLAYLYAKLIDAPVPSASVVAEEQRLLDTPAPAPIAAPPGQGDLSQPHAERQPRPPEPADGHPLR